MGDGTGIEWADSTWNPFVGCTAVSPGCDHCYAARQSSGRLKNTPTYRGLADGGIFNGTIRLLPDRLDQPLRWTRPRRIFVNSMSDVFHEGVPDDYIAKVFAVMAAAPQHIFQLLTKRHGRMRALLNNPDFPELVDLALRELMMTGVISIAACGDAPRLQEAPLPNVWIGVSVEDQKWADIRIPALLDTPAAIRFLSCEPLLGPVSLIPPLKAWADGRAVQINERLHWVIAGGESGPQARPMHPDWPRRLRDECVVGEIAFHYKQWGEWSPGGSAQPNGTRRAIYAADGTVYEVDRDVPIRAMWTFGGGIVTRRGKKIAGRELDGRTWDEWPKEPVNA